MINAQGRRRLAQHVLQQSLPTWTAAGAQLGVGMGRSLSSEPGWDIPSSSWMEVLSFTFLISCSVLVGLGSTSYFYHTRMLLPPVCRASAPPETTGPARSRGRGRGLGLPVQPQDSRQQGGRTQGLMSTIVTSSILPRSQHSDDIYQHTN